MAMNEPTDAKAAWAYYRKIVNMAALAKRLGVSRGLIAHWTVVPDKYLATVSRVTGIPQRQLRPDVLDDPWSAL